MNRLFRVQAFSKKAIFLCFYVSPWPYFLFFMDSSVKELSHVLILWIFIGPQPVQIIVWTAFSCPDLRDEGIWFLQQITAANRDSEILVSICYPKCCLHHKAVNKKFAAFWWPIWKLFTHCYSVGNESFIKHVCASSIVNVKGIVNTVSKEWCCPQ